VAVARDEEGSVALDPREPEHREVGGEAGAERLGQRLLHRPGDAPGGVLVDGERGGDEALLRGVDEVRGCRDGERLDIDAHRDAAGVGDGGGELGGVADRHLEAVGGAAWDRLAEGAVDDLEGAGGVRSGRAEDGGLGGDAAAKEAVAARRGREGVMAGALVVRQPGGERVVDDRSRHPGERRGRRGAGAEEAEGRDVDAAREDHRASLRIWATRLVRTRPGPTSMNSRSPASHR
jgi:hypothetical protein